MNLLCTLYRASRCLLLPIVRSRLRSELLVHFGECFGSGKNRCPASVQWSSCLHVQNLRKPRVILLKKMDLDPRLWIFPSFRSKYPSLTQAANRVKITSPPFQNLAEVISWDGVVFQSFAKTRNFAQDIYADWVAPILHTDLYVQVWRKGVGMMPSNCSLNRKWDCCTYYQ